MWSFEKFSNRFFELKKNSQNLTFFLLERDLFHEIDQMFGQNVGISGWNVMFHTPVREFLKVGRRPKIQFLTQKFVKILKMAYLKNGLRSAVAIYMAEIWPLLGFGGWNVRFLGMQPRSESDCPASLIFLRGPAARLYFLVTYGNRN